MIQKDIQHKIFEFNLRIPKREKKTRYIRICKKKCVMLLLITALFFNCISVVYSINDENIAII